MATAIRDHLTDFYWIYNIIKTYTETLLYQVGQSSLLTNDDIEEHNDSNSLYVSWDGEDGTNDGSSGSPFRTIQYALEYIALNPSMDIAMITILDSNYYYCNDDTTDTITLNGIVLQGESGQTPVIKINNDSGSLTCSNMITMTKNGSDQAKLINIKLEGIDDYTQFNGINILDGIIKYCTVDGMTKSGIRSGTGTVEDAEISNTMILNTENGGTSDGDGIYIDEGSWTISRCLLHTNTRAGICITGASSKTIDIDYVTLSNNFYGINSSGSTNESITIDNYILFDNLIYDYYGYSGVLTNGCIGTISGITTSNLNGMTTRFNPLFVSTSDYRLRSVHNGYATEDISSPVIGASSEYKDLGCYDYYRIVTNSTGTDFFTNRPDGYKKTTRKIDAKNYYTGTGKCFGYQRTSAEILDLSWDDLEDAQFQNLKALYDQTDIVYLSDTDGDTGELIPYLLDYTNNLSYARKVNKNDLSYWSNVSLSLIKMT